MTTARPLIFDRYAENRATGSFILIDPATNFTAGAGMIANRFGRSRGGAKPSAAERLVRLARAPRPRLKHSRPSGKRSRRS